MALPALLVDQSAAEDRAIWGAEIHPSRNTSHPWTLTITADVRLCWRVLRRRRSVVRVQFRLHDSTEGFNQQDSTHEERFMRKLRVLGLVVSSMLIAQICQAQSALVNIPRQSQHAVLTQRIGITDVTINY